MSKGGVALVAEALLVMCHRVHVRGYFRDDITTSSSNSSETSMAICFGLSNYRGGSVAEGARRGKGWIW
jgi:hypothetical protein